MPYVKIKDIIAATLCVCAGLCAVPVWGQPVDTGDTGVPYTESMFMADVPPEGPVEVYVSTSGEKSDLDGRLAEKTVYCFLKARYLGNFFSLNVPEAVFKNMTDTRKKELVNYMLEVYGRSLAVFKEVFGYTPRDFKFNVTFGANTKGYPYNYIYGYSKTSNIFTDFLPYSNDKEKVLSPEQEKVYAHEIAHSMFGIALGNTESVRARSIEEGFMDYFSRKVLGAPADRPRGDARIPITPRQADRMKGLSQLDIDSSIWGRKTVLAAKNPEQYAGVTHHLFGLEFVNAFVSVFGERDLVEFLKRLKGTENNLYGDDLGTKQVLNIMEGMGYTRNQIETFREELYERLKDNVFVVTGPMSVTRE